MEKYNKNFFKEFHCVFRPWLVLLSGLSASLLTKGSLV